MCVFSLKAHDGLRLYIDCKAPHRSKMAFSRGSEDKQLSPAIICFQCPFPGLPCDYFQMGHSEAVFSLMKSAKMPKNCPMV